MTALRRSAPPLAVLLANVRKVFVILIRIERPGKVPDLPQSRAISR